MRLFKRDFEEVLNKFPDTKKKFNEFYNKIKLYRNHGLKDRDNVEVIGVNSRLDSLNAEVLNYRLKKLNNPTLSSLTSLSSYWVV